MPLAHIGKDREAAHKKRGELRWWGLVRHGQVGFTAGDGLVGDLGHLLDRLEGDAAEIRAGDEAR